ncbi:MAG: methylmalonyl Co-A mutase-associated GTPase MeaB [Acidobacteria bacterium]|nr:methylmalonyl Co-A mutase-associated GTPase MeaB [Acidobacteriota bacterium]
MRLLEAIRGGSPQALARGITLVEDGGSGAEAIVRACYPRARTGVVVGVTGPPGVGKSTLVSGIAGMFRRQGSRVAIFAVDPSSAFSGGAILGDRVRMHAHAGDPGVFIRSMASRGHPGGLARATADAVELAAAGGWDPILIETLGAGQDEIEIAALADAVLVVLMPGQGDDIQAIKAGLLEIADLFVINKADLPGADRLEQELLHTAPAGAGGAPAPPAILRTVAVRGEGVEALAGAIRRHLEAPAGGGERRLRRAEHRLLSGLRDRFLAEIVERARADGCWAGIVRDLAERRIDPYAAVERVWGRRRGEDSGGAGGER